ncbi:MAG: FAD-dependent monooxygenase [Pseudomonadota bacterium]
MGFPEKGASKPMVENLRAQDLKAPEACKAHGMEASDEVNNVDTADIIVAGAGPAGLIAGLAFAQAGLHAIVCGRLPIPAAGTKDTRTAALFNDSIAMLENLQVWPHLQPACAPLKGIRIIDDMGHMLRAPELNFFAKLLNLKTLGWNVPNAALVEQLCRAAMAAERCRLVLGETVTEAKVGQAGAEVQCASGRTFRARLLVAADGQRSGVRAAAGISIQKVEYPQAALTSIFEHSRPHGGVSTEFHRPGGPFTVVPMPGNTSSLVWMDTTDAIEHAAAADDAAFLSMVEERLYGLLGSIASVAPRARFPLATLTADRLVAPRVALVGEAAHAFPPIGAQGLNLSLRDIALLADVVATAWRNSDDIGATAVLARYQRQRTQDVRLRSWGVDKLNRSLTSVWPGVNLMRGGLAHAVHAVPPLQRALMRAGLTGTGQTPPLMIRENADAETLQAVE